MRGRAQRLSWLTKVAGVVVSMALGALRRLGGRPRPAWLTVAILVVATGCTLFYDRSIGPERMPTVIGIIAEEALGPANELELRLEDGRNVTIATDATPLIGARVAEPGRLLLAALDAEEPWFVTLPSYDAWPHIDLCFVLQTSYAYDRDRAVITREGLIIQKAPGFHGQMTEDGRYGSERGASLCLDEEGQALAAN